MAARQLSAEAEKARAFAKMYVHLVEALQAEGLTEERAREEARIAASVYLQDQDARTTNSCPLCGK